VLRSPEGLHDPLTVGRLKAKDANHPSAPSGGAWMRTKRGRAIHLGCNQQPPGGGDRRPDRRNSIGDGRRTSTKLELAR